MCRAIVISVLFHLLVLAGLMEVTPLPAGTLQKEGRPWTLPVTLAAVDGIDKNGPAFRGGSVNTGGLQGGGLAARATPDVSHTVAKLHGSESKDKSRGERSPLDAVEMAEDVAFLPADVEREYRISLARAARQARHSPADLTVRGQEGVVRMTILYLSRLGRSNVTLEQSSGYPELDREALRVMALAVARVPLPEGGLGVNFRMQYALEYRLSD